MKFWAIVPVAAAVAALAPPAQAAPLKVVGVAAPAINCVFDASCKVSGTDSLGSLSFTPLGDGARLQSRTVAGKPGTPGAGKTAYLYRVDLTKGAGFTDCTAGQVLNFGPVSKLTYPSNNAADMFVITSGGLGSVGVKSAEQDGDVITILFDKYLCAGDTSYFFGLASPNPPVATTATLYGIGYPPIVQTTANVPKH